MSRQTKLLGRVLVHGNIKIKTGLRIGDTQNAITIGGVDLPVIRDRRTNEPYIPGSSLKGKLRSLSEKLFNAPLTFNVNPGRNGKGRVDIHAAQNQADYDHIQYGWINKVFGTTGDGGDWITAPNRLLVRDIRLTDDSRKELLNAKTDLPYTEVKWEAAIDRVTSAATPRQIERVPAGAVFGPMELVFNVFLKGDQALFGNLITAMQLLEDDYLGGHGSRGSGKIEFQDISVVIRHGPGYQQTEEATFAKLCLAELTKRKDEVVKWIETTLALA